MIEVKLDKKNILLKFPKKLISKYYLEHFMERLEAEEFADKNEMSETQAWELSEQIKNKWWNKNKKNILKK